MRVGRLILVVSTLVTILLFPLLLKDAVQALRLPSAYAAPSIFDTGGRVYQNGNNDPNNDDDDDDQNNENDDESDNEGEEDDGNDNVECYLNLNDNEPVPCDFEDNDNDGVYYPPENDNGSYTPPPPSSSGGGSSGASTSRCFGSGETGNVFLDAPDYDVTITVVNPLGSDARLDLRALDPTTVPAVPAGATLLDSAVWQLDARSGCDGAGITNLPAAVNNGFAYTVSANKSKLQIVRLENGVWVEVPTVADPDPAKSYISATIQNAGTYAVIQKP
jgi:hypothetical protein